MRTRLFSYLLSVAILWGCLATPAFAICVFFDELPTVVYSDWTVRGPGGDYGMQIVYRSGGKAVTLVLASKDIPLPVSPSLFGVEAAAAVATMAAGSAYLPRARRNPA